MGTVPHVFVPVQCGRALRIKVALGSDLSSETARVGDVWHGTVTENVRTQNQGVIPPGSEVEGVITGVARTRRGSPAMLELRVQSIQVNGHEESIAASAEPLIARSPDTHRPGAIAGGTSADAPIGEASGDGKHAVAAGILDGAAFASVATSKGQPVVLSDGTVMGFTVNRTVYMR